MSNMKEEKSKRSYRRYDDEFKKNAVKLLESGRSISDVSQALGVKKANLYEWKKQYCSQNQTDQQIAKKLKLVEKKLKQVEEERDILKKALSIFSRQI